MALKSSGGIMCQFHELIFKHLECGEPRIPIGGWPGNWL